MHPMLNICSALRTCVRYNYFSWFPENQSDLMTQGERLNNDFMSARIDKEAEQAI